MSHTNHRELQAEILSEAISILQNDSHVLGLVAGGSYARKQHDAFSDLDIGCYLRDEDRTGREVLYNRVATISPLLCKLWVYDLNALYLFENGVRLDIDFLRPSDIQNISKTYADSEIMYDPHRRLTQLPSKSETGWVAKHPKWFEPGADLPDWFFWMFRQIVCWAKRGAQNDYRAFDKLSSALNSLAEVRTHLIEMCLWTSGNHDYLSRVDPEFAQRISQTYPRFSAEEIIQSAKLLLKEYEYICPKYCHKAGVPYPVEKVKVIHGLIAEFERLE